MLLLSCAISAYAADGVTVMRGALEGLNYPDLESNINKIWQFTKQSTGTSASVADTPIVYFAPVLFAKDSVD